MVIHGDPVSSLTVHNTQKSGRKPHPNRCRKIPPERDAARVAAMEDVLRVNERPCDPDHPVVCMVESCKHRVGEVRNPIPMSPGQSERVDGEYVRNGLAEFFMAVDRWRGEGAFERASTGAVKTGHISSGT